MMIIFYTSEEEQRLDSSLLEGHIPTAGDFIDWQFLSVIPKGMYRVERTVWSLMGGVAFVKLWIVPVP